MREIGATIEQLRDAVALRLEGQRDRSVAAELNDRLDRLQNDDPARLGPCRPIQDG